MSLFSRQDRLHIWSWALYDFANSAFATTVMAGFFPLFFKMYWSHGIDPKISTLQLGVANSVAALLLAICAPILGALADQAGRRKLFLFLFTALGIFATAGLFVVARGDWFSAIVLFTLGMIGLTGACNFYDALLPHAAGSASLDLVSCIGYGLGYLGGGLLLVLNSLMYLKPELFGLSSGAEGVLWSFLTVAVWWALFSLPIFVFLPEPPAPKVTFWKALKQTTSQLIATFHEIRRYRNAALFLVAYFFYIDGVGTIMKMAVDYGMALGFDPGALIKALLVVQFVGFPAAIGFGYIGKYFGPKTGIYLGIAIYTFVTFYSVYMQSSSDFYLLAVCIGLAQGGIQALSRSFFASQVPKDQSGEFFGFFNLLGKFSSILGPTLMGLAAWLTGNQRNSVLSLIILFAIGTVVLFFVRTPKVAKK